MLKYIKISILLFYATACTALAQLESVVGSVTDIRVDEWYNINVDSKLLQVLSEHKPSKNEPFQFAVPIEVNLNPSNAGCLYNIGNELIWIVGIRSKSARSLNLILDPFHIPDGAYLYIYNSDRTVIRGAFGSDNNNYSNILPTLPVPGEELILEYHIPTGKEWEGTLGISQVSHDFLGLFGSAEKDGRFNLSQPCNVDINCPEGAGYANEERAVCRIIIRGIELCSGVLVNNTNQQNRPLLLTAQHCITDNADAAKSVFVFGYESPWCKGPDGRVLHSISGSLLQSVNTAIDFSLVELSSFPPITYKPYLAGWDVTGTIPLKTAAIHHPSGDVKKISIDLNSPVTATFSGLYTDGYWKILQWENGTTEGGSSGSPLFDQNKKMVGILTGGEAVCGRSVNDYFAKLSVMYNSSTILWQQLKGWIDPAKTGVTQLNGRDPYAINWLTVDTLSNMTAVEVPVVTIYSLPKAGYATGFNSDSLVMYAEHFNNPAGRQIGEVLINIAKANSVLSVDSARIYVFNDGVVPGTQIASQRIWLSEAKDTFLFKVDFKNPITVGSGFYIGWRIWYNDKAVSETRQFAPFHSPDRGSPSLNTAWFYNGLNWKKFTEHPSFPMSVSLDVKVVGILNSVVDAIDPLKLHDSEFRFYPNPARDFITVESINKLSDVEMTISGIEGNLVYAGKLKSGLPGQVIIDISGIKPGVYIVRFMSGSVSEIHKLLIVR